MAIVKKSDAAKTAVQPVKIEVTQADEKRIEEELFGTLGDAPAAPATASAVHGVSMRKISSVKKDDPDAAKQKSKLSSLKKPLVIKKKAVVTQEAVEAELAAPTVHAEEKPVTAADHSTAAAVQNIPRKDKVSTLKTLAEQQQQKEKDKEREKEKEKERHIRETLDVEARSVARLEKALTSMKVPVTPVVNEDDYEEVEEVVSEIIEEIEYEDEIVPEAVQPIKSSKDDPKAGFGAGAQGQQQRRRKKKKRKTPEDTIAAKDAVKRTMAKINVENTASRKKYRKTDDGSESEVVDDKTLFVSDFMSIAEIANQMMVKPNEVIAACMKLGIMATMNQRLDFTTIAAVVDEFGFNAQLMEEYAEESIAKESDNEDEGELTHRAPIVTVMGHVDHGKTSLLDYIRRTNVMAGEAGGITQHIGAYRVNTAHGPIAFLDTPGHEAFATMRARGARITDVIILVIAADSHVMPQTIESIDHAKAAGVKLVVAINKVDLPTANPMQIKSELTKHGVVVEEFGGNVVAIEISCKSGMNIPKLLDMVAAEAELLELKANSKKAAVGTIIEARMDSRLGTVATVLIQAGTLKTGDDFVTGAHYGRVKQMTDEHLVKIDSAGPSTPVRVLGLSGTPRAGDSFTVVENERVARDISVKRSQAEKEREIRQIKHISLDDLYSEIKQGAKDLNLVVKGDVDGSVEALSDSLAKLSTDKLKVNIVHKSVGAIKESDVLLAATANAVIIGFHVNPNSKVRELAEKEGVEIRLYKIIYEAIEALQKAIEGMLEPVKKEVIIGTAKVRETFKISKVGTIAGSIVESGTLKRSAQVRVLRNEVVVSETKVASLKRHKDDVSEVQNGFECGIMLEGFNEFQPDDIIEFFEIQMIKASSK
ncbi:MAG: translation initiation factor IF-2 [Fibrobacteres bacterium]|nr:translation initiation factor IF-2 [Fibrobacterota bacterium]